MPSTYGRYFEPFLGSGALFFRLEPEDAVLNDALSELIRTYQGISERPEEVMRKIAEWEVSSEQYYRVRSLEPASTTEHSARFIYLNKTCWNGLYRVNSSGRFNVPYGRPKTSWVTSDEVLQGCSRALATATLRSGDFEAAVEDAAEGDFVYFDPPYVTGHNNNGFVEYNESLFSWEDQRRLSEVAHLLRDGGVHVMVSNADHPSIRELYADFNIDVISRHSTLASSAAARRRVTEIIATS